MFWYLGKIYILFSWNGLCRSMSQAGLVVGFSSNKPGTAPSKTHFAARRV
jgi:hypothetical protein